MTLPHPPWLLLGAGNMGTLAAHYLHAAGVPLAVLRRQGPATLEKTLHFADGRERERLTLPVVPLGADSRSEGRSHSGPWPTPTPAHPIRRLIVACKTPHTAAALNGLPLAEDALVLRLQNGLGSLDGLLPKAATLIEVVTTTAVKGHHPEHTLVAENQTWMGPGDPPRREHSAPPAWFQRFASYWPGLQWAEPIRHRQWHKLVANAVINPLTGLHDVPNGALLENAALRQRMAILTEQADALLARLDPAWPGNSLARVVDVVRATADNTSSMRADMQRGVATEIHAINGWLLREAEKQGLDLPAHREILAAVITHSGAP